MIAAAPTATIRRATEADLPACVAMGRAFLQETAYGARPDRGAIDNDAHFSALAQTVLAGGGLFVAVDPDDRPLGMIAAVLIQHPVLNIRMGAEVIWWVNRDARGSGAGRRLFDAAEAWARAGGAVKMQFSAYRDPRLEWLYAHWGYHPEETIFEKDLAS